MKQAAEQLTPMNDHNPPLNQQQQEAKIKIPVAKAQRLTPNLPCRDLLLGLRENYLKIAVPLYEASITCDWKAANAILKERPELVRYSITENSETALHVAASAKDIALQIVEKYPKLRSGTVLGVLARKPEAFRETECNFIGRTIKLGKYLHSLIFITNQPSQNKPAEVGSVHVQDLAQKPNASPEKKSDEASPEKKSDEASPETKPNIIRRSFFKFFTFIGSKIGTPEKENKALPLLKIIWDDIATKHKKVIDDIIRGPPEFKQEGKPSIGNVDQAMQLQKLISECIVNMHVEIQNIIKQNANPTSGKEAQALQQQNLVSEHIAKMHVETQNIISGPAATTSKHSNVTSTGNVIKTYPNRILFAAAETGNTKFLIELIRLYPDLIWKVNDNNLSIFHIAVEHRHEGIYNLLYEIGSMKDLITPLKDLEENNMLHLVGKSAKLKRLQDVSGAALQMQRELLWFQEVEAMIPPSYRERKNKEGLTPYELFTREHKDLVSQGERWMRETANQCMVVAALIATIVFAAAFTVPGGYDQNNGTPFYKSKATFIVFVVADAISLFSSSASILMFLSILTSRYAECDFLESLPKKLMLGLATLFLSITTMTVVFGVSFFVLYRRGLLWIPIVIAVFALLPVLLYIKLQYSLFVDVISSTYGSRYLFKPQKHVLYYENPKV